MDEEKTKNKNQEGIRTKSAFFETVPEQKKKLSGAQRRKLRKEQNRSERMLLREMRLSQKSKGEKITSEFKIGVIERRHPVVSLNQRLADLILEVLFQEMEKCPSGTEDPLHFRKTLYKEGVLWLTCGNERTKVWLRRTVVALGSVLDEAEVSTVDWVERPRGRRYSVFIPGPVEDLESVKERIGRQNPGLKVDLWYLRTNIRENGGQNLKFTIDMKSFVTLRAMGFEAYYGLKKVTFKKLNNPKPWRRY